FVLVFRFLAGDAQPDAGNRVPARLRNRSCALRAMAEAGAVGQPALRAADAILHGGVDLILYCAVSGPSGRHCLHLAPGGGSRSNRHYGLWPVDFKSRSHVQRRDACVAVALETRNPWLEAVAAKRSCKRRIRGLRGAIRRVFRSTLAIAVLRLCARSERL